MSTVKMNGLTAVITHKTEGRKVVGSHVYIAIQTSQGNIGVASALLGGKYNQEQGLQEFKKNTGRFNTIQAGFEMAKAMNLI